MSTNTYSGTNNNNWQSPSGNLKPGKNHITKMQSFVRSMIFATMSITL
jgi:hypothetical protein